jgi:hypothetical protein
MIPRILSACLLLLLPFAALAQVKTAPVETYPEGPQAGHDLVADILSRRPAENARWNGILRIYGRSQPVFVPVTCETVLSETNWSVSYQTAAAGDLPAEKLTVVFCPNQPNQYYYSRSEKPGMPLGPPKNLTADEADIPLGGSDFWLSDLAFEFYHWPVQIRQKGQMQRSRPCFVIESLRTNAPAGAYARVITWVDKESSAPLQASAYGADKKIIKDFEIGSIEKVNGRYQVKDLKMFNRRTHSRTELEFDLDK